MGYDGIVIGGGAAGMFAAVTAAKRGQKGLLLEKSDDGLSSGREVGQEACVFRISFSIAKRRERYV